LIDAAGRAQVLKRKVGAVLVLVMLTALCGGSAVEQGPAVATAARVAAQAGLSTAVLPAPSPSDTAEGQLEGAAFLNRIAAAEIARAVADAGEKAPSVTPVYAVDNHRLVYRTLDGSGRPITASGLVSVPVKPPGTPSPVISYQHGTIFHNAQAPSNHAVAAEAAVVMASLGYIVVAADYVGYGASAGAQHPYLMAAPSASAVLDLLTALRSWQRDHSVADNGQLFLAGYSEGGYVTLAAHRAMQAGRSPHLRSLVASVAGAGPYHLDITMDALFRTVRDKHPLLGALLDPALVKVLGGSLRRELRRVLVRQMVPKDADVVLQTSFIDNHLAGDRDANARLSNVDDWTPEAPLRLFHGRDDRTVPHAGALHTVQAMRARGALGVSLTACVAAPSSHRNCVAPYWDFLLATLGGLARDR
jgi:dienelactone hydrolase